MAIRLQGIAAPEWGEPGSAEATEAIETLVLGKEVRCELTGKQTYDRCVAVCYLNGAMSRL
jgi:endonuclease YncB( thermonuclease family)